MPRQHCCEVASQTLPVAESQHCSLAVQPNLASTWLGRQARQAPSAASGASFSQAGASEQHWLGFAHTSSSGLHSALRVESGGRGHERMSSPTFSPPAACTLAGFAACTLAGFVGQAGPGQAAGWHHPQLTRSGRRCRCSRCPHCSSPPGPRSQTARSRCTAGMVGVVARSRAEASRAVGAIAAAAFELCGGSLQTGWQVKQALRTIMQRPDSSAGSPLWHCGAASQHSAFVPQTLHWAPPLHCPPSQVEPSPQHCSLAVQPKRSMAMLQAAQGRGWDKRCG